MFAAYFRVGDRQRHADRGNAERAKEKVGPKTFSAYLDRALQNQLVADGMAEYARLRAKDPMDDLFDATEADA